MCRGAGRSCITWRGGRAVVRGGRQREKEREREREREKERERKREREREKERERERKRKRERASERKRKRERASESLCLGRCACRPVSWGALAARGRGRAHRSTQHREPDVHLEPLPVRDALGLRAAAAPRGRAAERGGDQELRGAAGARREREPEDLAPRARAPQPRARARVVCERGDRVGPAGWQTGQTFVMPQTGQTFVMPQTATQTLNSPTHLRRALYPRDHCEIGRVRSTRADGRRGAGPRLWLPSHSRGSRCITCARAKCARQSLSVILPAPRAVSALSSASTGAARGSSGACGAEATAPRAGSAPEPRAVVVRWRAGVWSAKLGGFELRGVCRVRPGPPAVLKRAVHTHQPLPCAPVRPRQPPLLPPRAANPPPSLPYIVDTSLSSLRTNWTRLVSGFFPAAQGPLAWAQGFVLCSLGPARPRARRSGRGPGTRQVRWGDGARSDVTPPHPPRTK
jgi:hypothetical protein